MVLKLSLARKLTLLSMVASAVAMAGFGVYVGVHDASSNRALLVDESVRTADMMAAGSGNAVERHDAAAAMDVLRIAELNPQVVAAALVLRDGTVLARIGRATVDVMPEDISREGPWQTFRADRLIVGSPIRVNGHRVATACLTVDLGQLQARTRARLWRFVLALILALVVAGAIAARLQRIVSGPLLGLTAITRAIARDQTFSLRAPQGRDDEVGELVAAFNDMLEHIQQRDQALHRQRDELERMVEMRTAELRDNLRRYKVLVESTMAVPWEADASLKIRYVAPQAERLSGYEAEALMTEVSAMSFVHPDDRDRVWARLSTLAAEPDERGIDYECRLMTAEGGYIDTHTWAVAQSDEDVDGVVLRGVTIDVTRQKRLERELHQAQKLESVGRLAAGVAHEINTPIQYVSDSVLFLRDAAADLLSLLDAYKRYHAASQDGASETAETALQLAIENGDVDYLVQQMPAAFDRSLDGLDRVATIVRSMKEFAHPDSKDMAAIDLNRAIQSTLVIASNTYKYVADVEEDYGELPLVTCHGGDINQALLNIIVNAAQAIAVRVQGTSQRGRIGVRTRASAGWVTVEISDTGGGIPEAIRGRIFDPFFTTKDVGEGTGQGLAIAHAVVVDKHRGELSFDTVCGEGTTFRIRLPLATAVTGVAA